MSFCRLGDDDIDLSANINLPVDVSGTVKIHTDGSDDTSVSNDDGLDEPYPKPDKRKWKDGTKIFDISSTRYKNGKIETLLKGFPQLFDLSELELCKLHFYDEVDQLFIDFTKKYGNTQKNYPKFNINRICPWDFFYQRFVYTGQTMSPLFVGELNVTKQR